MNRNQELTLKWSSERKKKNGISIHSSYRQDIKRHIELPALREDTAFNYINISTGIRKVDNKK